MATKPRRRRRAAAATAVATAASVGIAGWLAISLVCEFLEPASAAGGDSQRTLQVSAGGSRHLLGLPQLPAGNACTPRSIETFPPDLFSLSERRRGALALHSLAALWLFAGLAIVCDDYFVASLEVLCDVLHLKPDVAGATFMAAGSSAPELFTSVIGVFLTRSDVGVSTIVGSAVFNLLFIVSLCGLFATQTIILSWWPIFRDCSYYSLSVVSLIIVIFNEEVHWYESAAFLILYAVYIVIMYFNESIDQWISARWPRLATGGNQRLHDSAARATAGSNGSHRVTLGPGPVSLQDFGQERAASASSAASARGAVAYSQLPSQERLQSTMHSETPLHRAEDELPEDTEDSQLPGGSSVEMLKPLLTNGSPAVQMIEVDLQQSGDRMSVEVSSGYESPLLFPVGWHRRAYWCVTLPWTLAFFVTIPDCRRPGRWRKTFFVALVNSILWIAGMSYLLVWMVCVIGDTMGIPDTVMGLTLLAAGTSVPDALASVFVVRDGFGDMAVSNSVGSNVFDILLGLGLPWFIGTALRSPGSVVAINSAGLTYSSAVLLSTVLLLLIAVCANRMRLDRKLGVACLLLYLLFITVSVLFETNVFARLNPPPCPRKS